MNRKSAYILISIALVSASVIYWLKKKLSKFQKQVVSQTNFELEKWIPYNELDGETASIIQDYWKRGVGLNFTTDQIVSSEWQDNYAWSAAFTSWVMNVSGAGDSFPYSATHSAYIIKTTDNRYNNPKAKFKAYDVSEMKPKPSDLVCKTRAGTIASYGDVVAGDKLHCDIVTDVTKDSVIVVGGNINNKVTQKKLTLDSKGYINEPDYFVLIKNDL